ncbi:hypothetical protein EDB85DRAFT_1897779 [Lactarius pseudohatsudake]|nr:hypothetical protein EDB85DRAFT_1897779 [Lactarius pseudohatsudake]
MNIYNADKDRKRVVKHVLATEKGSKKLSRYLRDLRAVNVMTAHTANIKSDRKSVVSPSEQEGTHIQTHWRNNLKQNQSLNRIAVYVDIAFAVSAPKLYKHYQQVATFIISYGLKHDTTLYMPYPNKSVFVVSTERQLKEQDPGHFKRMKLSIYMAPLGRVLMGTSISIAEYLHARRVNEAFDRPLTDYSGSEGKHPASEHLQQTH